YKIDHIGHRVLFYLFAGNGGECPAYTRVKKFQVVIYFRSSSHGRTRIGGIDLLFDSNGRGYSANIIYFGFIQSAEKLPGIGRKAFHIPSLPLCIKGVKSEAGLAGA